MIRSFPPIEHSALNLGSLIFVAISGLLFVLGLDYVRMGIPEGPRTTELRVEPERALVGDVSLGTTTLFRLTFRNVCSRSIRLVGCENICTPSGCFSVADLPMEIPAFASRDVNVRVKTVPTSFLGEFSHDLLFYTDSAVNGRIAIRVSGRVIYKHDNN
jgi:hypothetical protein